MCSLRHIYSERALVGPDQMCMCMQPSEEIKFLGAKKGEVSDKDKFDLSVAKVVVRCSSLIKHTPEHVEQAFVEA